MKKGIYILLAIVSICIIACGVIVLNNKNKEGTYISDSDYLYDVAKEYLINQEKENSHDKDMPNFNSFIAYKGFGIQENLDKTEKYAYMWILQENYYVLNDQLCSSTGSSMAYKFTFKDGKVVKYNIPEDGSRYTSSMKNIFPSDIYNKISQYGNNVDDLTKSIQEQLKEYYKGIDVSKKNNVVGTTFAGIIERNDIDNKTIYVQGFKDNDINYKGEFVLRISDKTNIGYNSQVLKQEDLKRGDTIKILFSGSVLETYPGQIDEVISIIKYDSDKLVLLDAPHKSSGFVYSISKEDKEEVSNIIKKSTFTNETCDGIPEYVFKMDNIEYGIEIFTNEIHITRNNEETKLTEEYSQKLLSILNNYLPHNDEAKQIIIATTGTLNGITYNLKPEYTRGNNQRERGYYIDTLNQPNAPYWYIICSGERSTGGYSINISNIEIDEKQNCKVTVRETSPSAGEVVTQALTYPTCILELSKAPTSITIQNEQGELFNYIQ